MNYTSTGILIGAEGWGLVSLGGMIFRVNFSFLLRSAESEEISRDIAGGLKGAALWVELQWAATSLVTSTLCVSCSLPS